MPSVLHTASAKLGQNVETQCAATSACVRLGHNTPSCCARGEANAADASLRAEATAAHLSHLSLHAVAAIAH